MNIEQMLKLLNMLLENDTATKSLTMLQIDVVEKLLEKVNGRHHDVVFEPKNP